MTNHHSIDQTWYDEDRLDEAVLALLYLTAHHPSSEDGTTRSFKQIPEEIFDRLARRGYISTPHAQAKSVILTYEGRTLCEAEFQRLFGKPIPASIPPHPVTHLVEEEDGD